MKGVADEQLRASVIIPTTGRRGTLDTTLHTICQQDLDDAYEVVVVENTRGRPRLGHLQLVETETGVSVRHVHEPSQGLHHARHRGARVARADLLVYVDDDVIVHPGWLRAMIEPFQEEPVAIVGGKVAAHWQDQPPAWVSELPALYLSLLDLGDERVDLAWPSGVLGCNMAVRRQILWEVRGFNPDAVGQGRAKWLRGDGETGLHRKVFAAGYRVVYNPEAWLHHVIPPERLTTDYFLERAMIHGISSSYSGIRESPTILRVLARGTAYAAKSLVLNIQAATARDGTQRLERRIAARFWWARSIHHVRGAIDRSLRRHVLRSDYL